MTRQLHFAVDGLTENFLERCWLALLNIADGCDWQRLRGIADARRHTKNRLHSLRKAILRFGWSWGEKELVWGGELIRFAWGCRESVKHFAAVPFARTSTSGASATFGLITMESVGAFACFEALTADGYVPPDSDVPPLRSCLTALRPTETGSTPCPPPCK